MYSMQINSTKKLLIMQETEIYEWNLFYRNSGWEFSGNSESAYEIFITRSRKQTA